MTDNKDPVFLSVRTPNDNNTSTNNQVNISNITQNNSTFHEDEGFLRTKKEPASKENRRTSVQKKGSTVLDLEEKKTCRQRVYTLMTSKMMEIGIIALIIVYSLLVLANVILDDSCGENSSGVQNALNALKYTELVILVVFALEIILKCYAFGIKEYFKDCWYIIDALIIVATFALVIIDLMVEDGDLATFSRIRGIFRLFRIMLLMRKANEVQKVKKNRIRVTGIDVKSPAEKVMDLLESIKGTIKDKEIIEEIQWAVEMIESNKLYDVIIENDGEDGLDTNEANKWLKSYGTTQKKRERRMTKFAGNVLPNRVKKDLASQKKEKTIIMTKSHSGTFNITDDAYDIMERDLDTNEFDVFAFADLTKGNELSTIMYYLFEKNNFFDILNIDQDVFIRFAKKIQGGYKPNPYHNCTHAADVTQGMHYLVTKGEFVEKADVTNHELAAMYIAAAVHDYEHPGTNNIYQNYSREEYKQSREWMIQMILATDMSTHFAEVAKLKSRIGSDNFDMKEKDKTFMMEMILHTADVGNPARPWKQCEKWTMMILTEFFNQGDAERDAGLPISNLCDKYATNKAKSQIGFIDYVISPLFNLMHEAMPGIDTSHLEINKEKWTSQIDFYQKELDQLLANRHIEDEKRYQEKRRREEEANKLKVVDEKDEKSTHSDKNSKDMDVTNNSSQAN